MFNDFQFFITQAFGEMLVMLGMAYVAICVLLALVVATVWAVRDLRI